MARARYPKHSGPTPAPLPPGERTIGQLVAEALRLYGSKFFPALSLGLPVAVVNQVYLARVDPAEVADDAGRVTTPDVWFLVILYVAAAPFLALAFAVASRMTQPTTRLSGRAWVIAVAAGTAVFLPAAVMLPTVFFLAVAWLAALGLVVPACLLEGRGPGSGLRRAFELARADYVHALASLATFTLVYWLTRNALVFLLREQAENTIRTAAFLGDLVLSPVLFLGAALLYADQVPRVGRPRRARAGRSRRR